MLFTGSEKSFAIISSNTLSFTYLFSSSETPNVRPSHTILMSPLLAIFHLFISLCFVLDTSFRSSFQFIIPFLTLSNLLLKSIHWLFFLLVPGFKADHFPCCSLLGGLAALFFSLPFILSLYGLVGFQLYWGPPLCFPLLSPICKRPLQSKP